MMGRDKSYNPLRLAFDNRDWDTVERLVKGLQEDKARLDHMEEERQRAKRLGWPTCSFHHVTATEWDVRHQLDIQRGVK